VGKAVPIIDVEPGYMKTVYMKVAAVSAARLERGV
jgi:hypothetical protein